MSNVTPSNSALPIEALQQRLAASWPNLLRARQEAQRVKEDLRRGLQEAAFAPVDTAVVAFGSLARGEWTRGSDLDWTLLIDGLVDAGHSQTRREITRLIDNLGHNGPGPTGVFGGLAFSHDIVHRIGGEPDTNRNTTQRILLLLESTTLYSTAPVRDRVIRALLDRYVGEDLDYRSTGSPLPRFLLNDIVRYWRTVAVDFAGKRQERMDGWALRNVKLRMSRKLVFAAGLWVCLSCKLQPSDVLRDAPLEEPEECYKALTKHLRDAFAKPPLEILAEAMLAYGSDDAARAIFGAYDDFLKLLDDESNRTALKKLQPSEAASDDVFAHARGIASRFQGGLLSFFFATDDELTKAVQQYGVF